jgi:N-acetylglucosamine kinase-like BadF-type ATPase
LDEDETIDILADIIIASHGTRAETVLADRIKECEEKGDEAGLRVWKKVAAKISSGAKK